MESISKDIMKNITIKNISKDNRKEINEFLVTNWYTTDMAVRGKIFDMTVLDGFAAYDKNKIIGLVTYLTEKDEYEIMSLDSLIENKGIGTALVNKIVEKAKEDKAKKIKLITTNDNINAIKFYQRRGFDLVRLYRNAVEASRKLKPSIPLNGDFNIPIKHELEFAMEL